MEFSLQMGDSTPKVVDNERQEDEKYSYATQLVFSSIMSMSLQSAIQLGVFEIIAKAGDGAKLSASEIAAKMPTTNPDSSAMVDRILRMLASYSVIDCSVAVGNGINDRNDNEPNFQRLYSLNPVTKYFVPNEDGVSLGPLMLLIQDKVFLDSWSKLNDAVLEGGIPSDRVHGMHAFEYPGLDPRYNQVFNTAMYNYSTLVTKKILDLYKGFQHLKLLIDVGGGVGVTLNLIISAYPHIKGINFDLPHVIEHASSYPGIEHVSGDMFEKVPNGETILMKWILHDWSDEQCLKVLKNCYKAIPDNGKVIVVESIIPVMPETSSAVKHISQSDVLMMTQNPEGQERSQQEFLALATAAGFSGIRFECFVSNLWVMEFFK